MSICHRWRNEQILLLNRHLVVLWRDLVALGGTPALDKSSSNLVACARLVVISIIHMKMIKRKRTQHDFQDY